MTAPKQQLDWVFSEELNDTESSWSSLTGGHDKQIAKTKPQQPFQPHVLFELLFGIALVYGIAVYLIWQHGTARMATLEQELVVLRQEILRRQGLERSATEKHETIALAQQIVATAAAGGKQNVQWRSVMVALQLYLKLEIERPGWQQEEAYLARRHFATTQPLHLVQQVVVVDSGQSLEIMQHMATADVLADPLIEFILNTFGYVQLPQLLEAFEEHETGETLVPAVFEMSAQEFEEKWHAYLEERYPTGKQKFSNP